MNKPITLLTMLLSSTVFISCNNKPTDTENKSADTVAVEAQPDSLDILGSSFALTTDLNQLSENEKAVLPHLIKAAMIMDELFWLQAYGHKTTFLNSIEDEKLRKFASYNYWPWHRLNDNRPFLTGFGAETIR